MAERLVIEDFNLFRGKHCQTAALMKILEYHGLHLSEEMLFGLGGGIGFIYWYTKRMPAPFIGARGGKREDFLLDICKRIGVEVSVTQTTSPIKGHEELKKLLREGEPAIVFVDMAYLPYFALPEEAHFGGHTIVVYGVDEHEDIVSISDLGRKPVTLSVKDLKKARSSKFPPMPPKNKLLWLKYPSMMGDLERGIIEGIKECCTGMLKPPINNIGLAGIKKWADIVPKWPKQFKGSGLFGCLFNTFVWIEISGTGGSAFRPMYAQFLKESSSVLNSPGLNGVAELFEESGRIWSDIATAALPNSWPLLKRIRELSVEKNRIFKEQEPGALEKMLRINEELDAVMNRTVEDLRARDLAPLLTELRERIVDCYEVEKRAFEQLNEISKVREVS